MSLTEKAAYLKGLLDGMHLEPQTPQDTVLLKVVDLLNEMAQEIQTCRTTGDSLKEYVEEVDYDLSEVEEVLLHGKVHDRHSVWQSPAAAETEEESGMESELYELVCPKCHDKIYVEEALVLSGNVRCPGCGTEIPCDGNADEFDENETDCDVDLK